MSEQSTTFVTIKTPTLLIHPHLFHARSFKNQPDGKKYFNGVFLVAKTAPDVAPLQQKIMEVAGAKWPGRALSIFDKTTNPAGIIIPMTDGDKEADKPEAKGKKEYLRGHWMLRAQTGEKYPPRLTDGRKGFAEATDDKLFYNGCFVVLEVNIKAYAGVGNNPDGVSAYLHRVAFIKDGPKLQVGGMADSEVFQGVVGHQTAENPLTGETGQTKTASIF